MIGAIVGDIVGSRFEWNNIKTKDFEFFHKFMRMGKEAKFALFASVALLSAMLLPLIDIYYYPVALTVSTVVAILMALFGVRFWVRLLAMPFVLIVAFVATVFAHAAICGIDTGSGDHDIDAQIFSSRVLAHCPLIGPITQTAEGRAAKVEFERDGDRLDDMRILPWRSYGNRHRRYEMLARIGAKFGMIAPLAIMALHAVIAVLCMMTVWKLQKGVYRVAAGWVLAILISPWINTFLGFGATDPDESPLFVVPSYLPFVNEMPELLLASLVQVGVLVAAIRRGWQREERMPGFGKIKCIASDYARRVRDVRLRDKPRLISLRAVQVFRSLFLPLPDGRRLSMMLKSIAIWLVAVVVIGAVAWQVGIKIEL